MKYIDFLKMVEPYCRETNFVHIVDGVVTRLSTGEVIPPELITTVHTRPLKEGGFYRLGEYTCGGAIGKKYENGKCSIGSPKQNCIDEGFYNPKECGLYYFNEINESLDINTVLEMLKDLGVINNTPCESRDYFKKADEVINEAYPDIYKKGADWWGGKRIPNFGILRGAIVRALKGDI